MKKCPAVILLIGTGIVLTIFGFVGKNTAYAQSEYNGLKMPLLSLVFMGINEEVYPWQIFQGGQSVQAATSDDATLQADAGDVAGDSGGDVQDTEGTDAVGPAASASPQVTPSPTPAATPEPDQGIITVGGTIEPYRESTHEEYLNHISADIYGTTGVERAAEYTFQTVDESYFDDALFIGDSRIVGLRDYTTLSEHADFYCETSLTIYDVFEKNIGGKGTIESALAAKDYGKIYLEVGINELGRGTTEDFLAQYTAVVTELRERKPDAILFLQAIMKVSAKKDASDAIFNNSNITARNNAIATLADNEHIFYVDMNPVVCDEKGNLIADYTFDQIHVLGKYNDLWKEVLLSHGVEADE